MNERPWYRFYPPGALDELDVAGRTLPDLLHRAVAEFGERPALSDPAGTWSFTDLHRIAVHLAAGFRDQGVRGGSRVAIMLPNCSEYVAALFGTWLAGGTVVQVNSAYTPSEVGRILEHSGAALIVTIPSLLARLRAGGVAADLEAHLVDENPVPVRAVPPRAIAPATVTAWAAEGSDVAVLQYTGGTTGLPKGVMLTHRNLLANIEQRRRVTVGAIAVPDAAAIVNTLPMCHVYGLTCITLSSLRTGLTQLIVPRFDARAVLELIRDARPFAFYGVPTMYTAFLRQDDLEAFGLDRVAVFNSAGAPMPPAQLAAFEARVGARIFDGFGISEAAPSTHTNPLSVPRRPGSSGIPVPFTDARTVEVTPTELVDVAPGEVGELIVAGPQVMKGYWNDPELTAATLREGWLLTGDLARIDEDGFLYIVGRRKEVIVAGGYNVYPAEVESVVGDIEGVSAVAVVGIPDDYRGETIKAVVVPVPGARLTAAQVIARSREHLAPFKIPRIVEFRDELPRTAVGKIDKRRLAQSPTPSQTRT